MPTKPLSEETPGWLKELITDFDFNFLEDYDNGLITDVGLVDGLKKAFAKAFKAGQTELAKKVEEVLDLEEIQPRHWSKSLEDVELGIATDGLFWFKERVKAKLAQLVEKEG